MVLIIDGVWKGLEWNNFMASVPDELAAIDLIADYRNKGLNLHRVQFIAQRVRTEIPVDMFNEHSLCIRFDQLQQQWEKIFQESPLPNKLMDRQRFINWNRRLVHYYDQQIAYTNRLKERLNRKQHRLSCQKPTTVRHRTAQFYQSLLVSYENRVLTLELSRQRVQELLFQWGG
ncbi:hypothetical protein ACO2Q8_01525 [Larkinella sp. VNQ87]|uniref:hypothetical protein n=1 Tax=Larkinella sp. VNQ87 TaxID=3400921 RepID=UPI003C025581